MHTKLQTIFPHHCLSRLAHWFADCDQPWVKNNLIRYFLHRYNVDMHLAVKEDPFAYTSFNDFFTRALKPEKRPIAQDADAIVSPVDGVISQIGSIHQGELIQAKGIHYPLTSLLGGAAQLVDTLQGGNYATLYLAPRDYHRVHMPYTGTLQQMIYIPGRLFSVNVKTTENLPQLFVRNERVVTVFNTNIGPMVIVLVGAMLVGSITTVWEGTVTPSKNRKIRHWSYSSNDVILNKGQELGRFQLGSTVIVIFPPQSMDWSEQLILAKQVQFGEQIGTINKKF